MKRIFTLILTVLCISVKAQFVGVGTVTPVAALDITSTVSGLLIPRLTTAQRLAIVAPSVGLLVFDSTQRQFYYHSGIGWLPIITHWVSKEFTATDGQTDFVPDIDITNVPVNKIAVYRYIRLPSAEWTKVGNTIVLTTASSAGETIFIDVY